MSAPSVALAAGDLAPDPMVTHDGALRPISSFRGEGALVLTTPLGTTAARAASHGNPRTAPRHAHRNPAISNTPSSTDTPPRIRSVAGASSTVMAFDDIASAGSRKLITATHTSGNAAITHQVARNNPTATRSPTPGRNARAIGFRQGKRRRDPVPHANRLIEWCDRHTALPIQRITRSHVPASIDSYMRVPYFIDRKRHGCRRGSP